MYERVEKYFGELHPDYDPTPSREQQKKFRDKLFIIENLDAIDNYYRTYSGPNVVPMTSQERMQEVILHAKTDRYFSALHPEFEELGFEEQMKLLNEKMFIAGNIDSIDDYYSLYSNSDSQMYTGKSQEENMVDAINSTKVDRYVEELHPDGATTYDFDEIAKTREDRVLIGTKLETFEDYYHMYSDTESEFYLEGTKKEQLREALKYTKTDKYFEILHPDYEELDFLEQAKIIKDKAKIGRNLDAVDTKFRDYQNSDSQNYMRGATEQEILSRALSEITEEKNISVSNIGAATVNAPTELKKGVEAKENEQKAAIREGEKDGYNK